MIETLTITGKSGESYNFTTYSLLQPWPRGINGIYAFVSVTERPLQGYSFSTISVGNTDSLPRDGGEYTVSTEVMAHGPTHFCLLPVSNESRRSEIARDLA